MPTFQELREALAKGREWTAYHIIVEEKIPAKKVAPLIKDRPSLMASIWASVSEDYIREMAEALGNPQSTKDYARLLMPKEHPKVYEAVWTAASKGANDLLQILINEGYPLHYLDNRERNVLHMAAAAKNVDGMIMLLEAGVDYQAEDIDGKTPFRYLENSPLHLRIIAQYIVGKTQSDPKVIKDAIAAINFMLEDHRVIVQQAVAIMLTHIQPNASKWTEALLKPVLPPSIYQVLAHKDNLGNVRRINRKKVRILAQAIHLSPSIEHLPGKTIREKTESVKVMVAIADPRWIKEVKKASQQTDNPRELYRQAAINYTNYILREQDTGPIIRNFEEHYPYLLDPLIRWFPSLRHLRQSRKHFFHFFSLPPDQYKEERYQGMEIGEEFLKAWRAYYRQTIHMRGDPERYEEAKKKLLNALKDYPHIQDLVDSILYHEEDIVSIEKSIRRVISPNNPALYHIVKPYIKELLESSVEPRLYTTTFAFTDEFPHLFLMGKSTWIDTCMAHDHPEGYNLGLLGAIVNPAQKMAAIYILYKNGQPEIVARRQLWLVEHRKKGLGIIRQPFYGHPAFREILDKKIERIIKDWMAQGYISWEGENEMEVRLVEPFRGPAYSDNYLNGMNGLIPQIKVFNVD